MMPLRRKAFHFYEADAKWLARGVTYGPFRLNQSGQPYPELDQARRDFESMAAAGVNAVRTYTPPDDALASMAAEYGLRLLVDVPWPKHLDVYSSVERQSMCLDMAEEAIARIRKWPNVLGVFLGNEIPADLARWAGERRVRTFLHRLFDRTKALAPGLAVGYANFPSTEYLDLSFFDFLGFNVYLHDAEDFFEYLARLRHLYPDTPLILSEVGIDSQIHGEAAQARILSSHAQIAYQVGMAGAFVFSWTDEWHTGGWDIEGWSFGLVDRERRPKPALEAVSRVFQSAPRSVDIAEWPRVSVVVATYNGGATLRQCLESLRRLDYPDYEVVVIDDGSTDNTQSILGDFPDFISIRQPNRGLSAARNAGIAAATGQIVAFTDSDCLADVDWLRHLAAAMRGDRVAAVGGPNVTPREERLEARCVALAPGHATHVMLSPREAEHIPGCNMAFRRQVLLELNGFDPAFRKAGDDVDVAWRLLDAGYRIAFSTGGFVWHHRRQSLKSYWKQQMGYGEAEAVLFKKHPHRFNDLAQSIWRGAIYPDPASRSRFRKPIVRYGVFGSGAFQCVYPGKATVWFHVLASLEWWAVCLGLIAAGCWATPALELGLVGLGASLAATGMKAWSNLSRAEGLSRASFPLVWVLWISQPLARGFARYWARLRTRAPSAEFRQRLPSAAVPARDRLGRRTAREYWTEAGLSRLQFLDRLSQKIKDLGWIFAPNTEWEPWDLSVAVSWWFKAALTSVEENHGEGKRLLRFRLRLAPTSLLALLGVAAALISGSLAMRDSILARLVLAGFLVLVWTLYRRALRGLSLVERLADEVAGEMGYGGLSGTAEAARPPDAERASQAPLGPTEHSNRIGRQSDA